MLSNFPDLEKVLKIEIKSGKIVESLEHFDVNSNLLLNRHMATWNLFVKHFLSFITLPVGFCISKLKAKVTIKTVAFFYYELT